MVHKLRGKEIVIRMSLIASVPGNNGHPRVIAHRTEEWVDDHNESYAFKAYIFSAIARKLEWG